MFYPHVNQSFRRKQQSDPYVPLCFTGDTIKRTTIIGFARGLYLGFGFSIDIFDNGLIETTLYHIVWRYYPLTKGKTIIVRVFLFQHPFLTNQTIFWTLLRSIAHESVKHFVFFLSWKKERYRLSTHMLIFVVNICPVRFF